LLIFLSILSSCSGLRNVIHFRSTALNEGEIYKKEHQPKRKTTILIPIVSVAVVTVIPFSINDDEDFILHIRKWNEEKDEYKYAKINVDKKNYEKAKIGEWYTPNVESGNQNDAEDIKTKL